MPALRRFRKLPLGMFRRIPARRQLTPRLECRLESEEQPIGSLSKDERRRDRGCNGRSSRRYPERASSSEVILRADHPLETPLGSGEWKSPKIGISLGRSRRLTVPFLCGDGRFGGTRTTGSYRNGQEVRPPVEFRARSDRPEKRETRKSEPLRNRRQTFCNFKKRRTLANDQLHW